jgi:endoglucanase
MNFGNALEAPNEGDWGVTLSDDYFDRVRDAGFETVRVPIRWSSHAGATAPFTIDAALFARVDWVVESALSRDLNVIINVHHYDEMMQDPEGNRARLSGIWTQIAERYRDRPSGLLFELLNEPNGNLAAGEWNTVIAELLPGIRASNPDRTIVIGGVSWNSIAALESLALPEDDPNLVATIHYYEPMKFTHQGADWVAGSSASLGTTWDGTDAQKAAIEGAFTKAAAWSARQHRPILLGEFGAYEKADMPSRVRWTAFVARTAEAHGMSWAYWEFASSFGVFDPAQNAYRPELLDALLPPSD